MARYPEHGAVVFGKRAPSAVSLPRQASEGSLVSLIELSVTYGWLCLVCEGVVSWGTKVGGHVV